MTFNYYYSATTNCFYYADEIYIHQENGTWPNDALGVEDSVFIEYTGEPPVGKTRGAYIGIPAWVDIPEPTHDELVAEAELMKKNLLSAARNTISIWQTELQLGIISDDDKASLISWLSYIKELQAVDTDTAPGVNWPVDPAA
jgi:hypothetical protein